MMIEMTMAAKEEMRKMLLGAEEAKRALSIVIKGLG